MGKPIYRGTPYISEGEITRISSPSDRKPLNMPLEIQKEIDDSFEKAFGVRFRQRSLFGTGSLEIAKGYAKERGEVRILRPLEPFCYCWSPKSQDLYLEYTESLDNESVESMISRLCFQTENIAAAINQGHEIMLVGSAFEAKRI